MELRTQRGATHAGHCQACGRLQKLPKGRLSKHGYTVTHGYFNGICQGQGHPPFEEDCSLVQRFIDSAKSALSDLEAWQAKLRVPATEPKAYVHIYERSTRLGARYVWRQMIVQAETITSKDGDFTYTKFWYTDDDAKRHEISVPYGLKTAYGLKTVLDIATHLNATYADWLEHEADSLRRYIQWQTHRVQTWTPKPLLALTAKDKEGFTPTLPRY